MCPGQEVFRTFLNPLSNTYYKQFNSFLQCINILIDNEFYYIKYKMTEGYSVSKPPINTEKYYLTYIEKIEMMFYSIKI